MILTVIFIVALVLVYFQFRGTFLGREQLTMISSRAGLSMDPGAKVTYNGVEIGRVGKVQEFSDGDQQKARIILDVNKQYLHLIPRNVNADITATSDARIARPTASPTPTGPPLAK